MKVGLTSLVFLMLIAGASRWAMMPSTSTGERVASCVPSEPPPQDDDDESDDEDERSPRQPSA